MTSHTSFAELVRTRREALSMTQAVLADAAGVTERTVQRVERGESPSPETVMALCSVLAIAPTTAHSALRQSPPTRPFDGDPKVADGFAPAALPPAHGPAAEGERSLAIAKLVRSGNRFDVITGPDLTAMAHDLVSDKGLRSVNMDWGSGDCEEAVIEEGRKRSVDNPLRKLIAWCRKGSRSDDDVGPLFIVGFLAFGHGTIAVLTVKTLYGEMWGNVAMIVLSLAALAAMFGWMMETEFEIAQKRLSGHWVMGIKRDLVAISKVRTNGIDLVRARDVAQCLIGRTERHLAFSYTTFDGTVHRLDYIPDIPSVAAALEAFEREVRDLSSLQIPVEPVASYTTGAAT